VTAATGLHSTPDHHITHKKAPEKWRDGFPLGNGEFGTMVWGDGNPLAFTLDRADLWDLRCNTDYMQHPDFNYVSLQRLVAEGRFDEVAQVFERRQYQDQSLSPTKISIGRAELRLGEATEYECQLRLGTATVVGAVGSSAGRHELQCFVHRDVNALCLRVSPCPPNARMALIPLAEMNESLAGLKHPEPQFHEDGESRLMVQQIPEGLAYAVAWNEVGPDFYLVAETGSSCEEARSEAEATWRQCAARGFDALHAEHVRAWDAFWAGSAVHLPERRMEFLWYHGLYLLASTARRGSTPPGLQGVWAMDGVAPPWRGDYHADMNVQETFWPACASGHLDLLDCWCDLMRDCLAPAQEYTRLFFGTEGTFWPCATFPRHTIGPCWGPVQIAWSHSGWLGWLVWLRWRYSMDQAWLDEVGYPLIAEIFKFYRGNLKTGEDGHLHIPLSNSPEYKENKPEAWCTDPNVDIALIRRCCDWVVEMEEALGRSDLTRAAREVHRQLVSYHLSDRGELCVWAGTLLDESHRHPSHLMAIHPAKDLTIEDGKEARRIIEASVDQFLSVGQYRWAGHTYAQMVSFAAVVGRAEWAYDCLSEFLDHWVGPNGLHFNRDLWNAGVSSFTLGTDPYPPFTIEANCGICAGISDMLVQGWNDVVRVFPAVPEHWRDVAFRDLLTEGAFRVSAARLEGRTVWLRVRAGVDRLLLLRDPFGELPVESTGAPIRKEGDLLIAEMKEGDELVVHVAGHATDLDAAIGLIEQSDSGRLGLQ